jgi:hypothetical protein
MTRAPILEFRIMALLRTAILVCVAFGVAEAFSHSRASVRPRIQRRPFCRGAKAPRMHVVDGSSPTTSILLAAVAARGEAEWKQFVPLITATLVIGDIALGSPAVKAITSLLYGGNPPTVEVPRADSFDGKRDPDSSRESKSRIDVDATALDALQKAEEALERAALADELRPRKGSVEEVRKRLDQQFKDISK